MEFRGTKMRAVTKVNSRMRPRYASVDGQGAGDPEA